MQSNSIFLHQFLLQFFVSDFSLPLHSTAVIKFLNVLGEEILSETVVVSDVVEKLKVDTRTVENGIYFVRVEAGGKSKIEKLVIAR